MKIALLSNEYPPETAFGGIGTYVGHLAKGLAGAGHEVAVVSLSLDTDKEITESGVKVIRLARPKIPLLSAFGWEWRAAQKLKELVKAGYEIIEAPAWTGQAAFYSMSWGVPLIMRLMTPYSSAIAYGDRPGFVRTIKTAWMERVALGKATLYLALSKSIGKAYQNLYKIDRDKIRLAPAGVPSAEKVEAKEDPNLILFLGRLEPRKGVDLLLRAMPKVWSEVPEAKLVLVGKDQPLAPGGKYYERWIKEQFPNDMAEKVKFTGFVSNNERANYLASCRLLVAPSRYESFGLIYLEAMVYGKPVIGTKNGGAEDIVIDGVNGYIAEVNELSLAEVIVKIMKDRCLSEKMGQESLRIYQDKFTVKKMVETTIGYYREAIKLWPK